ncbi:MAG: hypothetical protein EPN30_05440 [Actinomycetota bacterium]|nr:MAG: hypothetical protein EPN30_05440 [Actinomycetota bacterium]
MAWRLARRFLGPGKSRLITRAKGGDPLSIGLVVLFVLFRFAKKRSVGKAFVTKLLPGETLIISNIPKPEAKK